jgi:hypothetical protein
VRSIISVSLSDVGEVGDGSVTAHTQAIRDLSEREGTKLRRQRAVAQARPMPEFQAWNPGQPIRNFATDGGQNAFAVGHHGLVLTFSASNAQLPIVA